MSMRTYASGSGDYAYEDYREAYRRSSSRGSGHYEYGTQGQGRGQPRQQGGPQVRIVDGQRASQPQVVVIRDPEPAPIHIYREGGGQPQVRYVDERRGDGYGGEPQYYGELGGPRYEEPRYEPRYQEPRYEERGGDRYESREPREEEIPYRAPRRASTKELVIQAAEADGPGVYDIDGQYYEAVRTRSGGWQVFRTSEPMDEREVMPVRSGSSRGGNVERGPRGGDTHEASPATKPSSGILGEGARVALRIGGAILLAGGAFYAASGIVGGLTNGMSWGPLGRTAMNWQQAVPAIIGGGALALGGGLLMRFTKKKT